MHVARTDLNYINVLEKREVFGVHYLGNDGEPRFAFSLDQKLYPFALQALEIVGRGAGLERAAAKHGRACRFYLSCNAQKLLLALDRARSCHNGKYVAANTGIAHLDYTVIGVELAVCALKRLGYTLYGFNDVKTDKKILVNAAGVTHKTDYSLIVTLGKMHLKTLRLDPVGKFFYLRVCSSVFEYCDHDRFSLMINDTKIKIRVCSDNC